MTATQPSQTRVLLLLTISALLGTIASNWFFVNRKPKPRATEMILTEQVSAPQSDP